MSEHDTTTHTERDAQRSEGFRSWTESSVTGTVDTDLTGVRGDGEKLWSGTIENIHDEAERTVERAGGRA